MRAASSASSSRTRAARRCICTRSRTSSTAKPKEQSISRVDGLRSVSLEIFKVQQANIVEVGKGVDEAIADLENASAAGHQDPDAVVGREVHRRLARSRQGDDPRRRAAHDPDRVPVPALVALDDHHGPHAADLGDRDVHRAARVRLHAQLHDADGAVAVHRPPDRRRHRRAREHRAPRRHGQEPSQSPRSKARRRSGSPSWRRRSRFSRCSFPSLS